MHLKNIAALLLIAFGLACSVTTAQEKSVLAPKEFAQTMESTEEFVLLDVRTPAEWKQGVIAGARKLNFFEAGFDAQLDKLDKEQPVFVYCKAGGRSGKTAEKLKAKGFTQVYDLQGGITAWIAAERPVAEQ